MVRRYVSFSKGPSASYRTANGRPFPTTLVHRRQCPSGGERRVGGIFLQAESEVATTLRRRGSGTMRDDRFVWPRSASHAGGQFLPRRLRTSLRDCRRRAPAAPTLAISLLNRATKRRASLRARGSPVSGLAVPG